MFGLTDFVGRATHRAVSIAAVCLLTFSAGTLAAKAETRTLKFYNLHTKEKLSIAYKKNGRYSADGLKQINWFLRDWRRKEPTKMDTRLLDLVWEAYRQSGSRDYINVICGYRAPATNNMLRSRSSGVAKESQHTQGRALDFFIPDVPLKKMREIGLKMQVGGVGYYPRSGSPFVHFDVGNARHWPRMSRKELVAVFPKGNTVHVPSDGKPLPGYEQALASYKSRKGASAVQIANAGSVAKSGGGKTLLAALFGGGADEEDDVADVEVAAKAKQAPAAAAPKAPVQAPERTAPKPAQDVAVAAMVPSSKPNLLAAGVPLPIRDTFDTGAPTPPAGLAVRPETAPSETGETEIAALEISRIPLPRAAPGRPAAEPAKDDVSALVAALESAPDAAERAPGAPAQLAYAVPTPRDRPPFESILRDAASEPLVAAATPTDDEVKRIVEASSAMQADIAAAPKVAAATAPARPAAKPAGNLLLAALETPKAQAPQPAPVRAKVAVPAGKTGRFSKSDLRPAAQTAAAAPGSQQTISSRIAMASIVADPARRAATAVMKKPNADVLVRDVPTSVFTAGFAADPLANSSDRFVGSAVNFLPVAKFR